MTAAVILTFPVVVALVFLTSLLLNVINLFVSYVFIGFFSTIAAGLLELKPLFKIQPI